MRRCLNRPARWEGITATADERGCAAVRIDLPVGKGLLQPQMNADAPIHNVRIDLLVGKGLKRGSSQRCYRLCAACEQRIDLVGEGEVSTDPGYYLI